MRIVVAGGSGFIGRHLIPALVSDGQPVTVLTRGPSIQSEAPGSLLRFLHWNPRQPDDALAEALTGADAVINLAGTNIGSRRWTAKRKATLLSSRVQATETLVRAIERLPLNQRPQTLINASGIDYYGDHRDGVFTEASPPGESFLARLCQQWEQAANVAQALGVRVVLMRTAVVLAPEALTLRLMALPFRLLVGGPLGSGQQEFTWVHIDDVVGMYQWALGNQAVSGPVNVVAPDTRPQWQVAQAFGKALRRPSGLRTPAVALRLAMGEQADLLLHGRRAVPAAANAHSYTFCFPALEPALQCCFQHQPAEQKSKDKPEAQSPFFPVLGGVSEELPEPLRDQYLVRPGDTYRVVLEGIMDRIWHRPAWLWPFFRLLAVFDILFPEQGTNVKASMVVEGLRDNQGSSTQTWLRRFEFRKARRFDATMSFHPKLARVVERVRPGGVLEIVWKVTFEPPSTIHIVTLGMRCGLGRYRVALPRWAAVQVRVSETALDEQRDRIAVDLVMRHQWLGEMFGYSGTFQVRREPKEGRG
jgi:uncharacterized protein (TIGR01777 family)